MKRTCAYALTHCVGTFGEPAYALNYSGRSVNFPNDVVRFLWGATKCLPRHPLMLSHVPVGRPPIRLVVLLCIGMKLKVFCSS